MVAALMDTTGRLYGIQFVSRSDVPVYADGVKVWEVRERDGTPIGWFYADWFDRPTKRPGAWMNSLRDQNTLPGEQAIVVLCARTGLNCPVVLVQLPESLEANLKTATGAAKTTIQNAIRLLEKLGKPLTIAELTKIRIANAGTAILNDRKPSSWNGDVGFRAFKIDTSNYATVSATPDGTDQTQLAGLVQTFKVGRTNEDILFEVLISHGLDLSASVTVDEVDGHEVLVVDPEINALVACLDEEVDDALVREVAKRQPLKAIFKDSAFASDSARINAKQIFQELSRDTDFKVL